MCAIFIRVEGIASLHEKLTGYCLELAELQTELDELKDLERQISERVDAAEDAVDKILDTRSVAVRARETAARKIRCVSFLKKSGM